ncbi:MAG: SGNH/GDSL hydrolase family protein [Thermoguttaceae bacterium]|nr:SGNH/GDSL hydrolase family protein [Thermoguttaceae bacterium]
MKLIKVLSVCAVFISAFAVSGVLAAENPSVIHIQRTMKALEESTAENPAHLRVMFYGQSITAQRWTQEVERFFRETYPTVEFEFFNGAIGGFQSPMLSRTAECDLYPWYPDLLFFHVYGPMDKYEDIVKKTRRRTSAEIILWTSHLNGKENPEGMLLERDQRSKDILEIAERNNCMVIDLNKKWCRMLIDNAWEPDRLLNDGIHLNDEGCSIYARMIWEDIVRIPDSNGEPEISGTITEYLADSSSLTREANGDVTFSFDGNRVTAVSDGTADGEVSFLLDGEPMEGNIDLWTSTRPSNGPCWMPAINYVGFEKAPVAEDWTLTAVDGSKEDGTYIAYKVAGSVTGEDGSGNSSEMFVSNSGRAAIDPSDIGALWQFPYFKQQLPKDFQVTWSTRPMFTSAYTPGVAGERTVIVQNCVNGHHKLTVRSKTGKIGIEKWIVNRPAK